MSDQVKTQGEGKIVAKDSKANFGTRGWILVIFGILLLFCCGSLQNETLNVIMPKLNERYGWSTGALARVSSYATIAGGLFCIVMSPLTRKYGAKKLAVIELILMAIGTIANGFVTSIATYAVARILVVICTVTTMNYIISILATNWFPTKKGLAMGYITIGNNLGSMIAIWLMTFCWNAFGFSGGFIAYALIVVIPPLLLLILFLADYPEQLGCFPDNDTTMTKEKAEELLKEAREYDENSPWTMKKLFSTPQVWKVGLSLGLMALCISGILTHLVGIFQARGYSSTVAMLAMSVCSVAAIPMSVLLGKLDAKKGAKIASMVLAVIMAICFFLSLIPASWSAFFAGLAAAAVMGCLNNMATSLPASIFGRYDMARAQSAIMPLMFIFQAVGVGMTGTVAEMTGGFTSVLAVMGVCSIVAFLILMTLKDECIGRVN